MKVYVITASDFCGEDTKILSVWGTEDEAYKEMQRVIPDNFAVEVTGYELQWKVKR